MSLQSAASVLRNLDRGRFDVVPVAIDKGGRWLVQDLGRIEQNLGRALEVDEDGLEVALSAVPGKRELVAVNGERPIGIDVIFPVMHGPLYEDGCIQGLFELAEIAYVGCGVAASANAMDKELAKRLAQVAGAPVVEWVSVHRAEYERDAEGVLKKIVEMIGVPCFIKPANMGSSVGVTKVKSADGLDEAIKDALRYDRKVLAERAIDAREIEVAVLESAQEEGKAMTSIAGEITPHREFYSYQAKYVDEDGASLSIPAQLNEAQVRVAQKLAAAVFGAMECEGLARVDLFLDRGTGRFYFNELNTMPGFTSISMYPKLWEASELEYGKLLSHLVELALRRQERREGLVREYGKKG